MATPGPEHGGEQANSPVLCSNNCGFFANPACNQMCSKCYRDTQSEHERNKANETAAAAAMQKASAQSAVVSPPGPLMPVACSPSTSDPAALAPPQRANSPMAVPDAVAVGRAVAALEQTALEVGREPSPDSEGRSQQQASISPADEEGSDERPAQKNTSRCFSCKKKIGLTGFKCRCGYVFCGTHRYAEAHECSFDYKAMGRENLARNNPLVQANKITKF